jgi:hypothetical protein
MFDLLCRHHAAPVCDISTRDSIKRFKSTDNKDWKTALTYVEERVGKAFVQAIAFCKKKEPF